MTAAYGFERPEVEGDDLTDAQKAAVSLKVRNTLLESENRKLREGAPQPDPVSASSDDSYPRVDPESGRMMYGSWDDLADPYKDRFHPRNDPNDVAYKTAVRELAVARQRALNPDTRRYDETGHELDANGNPIPTAWEKYVARTEAEQKAALEAKPVWRSDGSEWLHPDLPEDDELNDPNVVTVVQEQHRRAGARRAAYVNSISGPGRRFGTVEEGMRAAGLLPPLDPDNPAQERRLVQEKVRQFVSEAASRLLNQTPQAEADRQRRINEALIKGDRKLAVDIMDGRA